jgi:hypothetical protein
LIIDICAGERNKMGFVSFFSFSSFSTFQFSLQALREERTDIMCPNRSQIPILHFIPHGNWQNCHIGLRAAGKIIIFDEQKTLLPKGYEIGYTDFH